jgi:hypothetical protein
MTGIARDGGSPELKTALRELAEAREREAATAEVLKAISRSSIDLPVVLDTVIASACRLCESDIGTIRYEEGAGYCLAATFGCRPEWREHFAGYSTKPDRTSVFGQTILKGSTLHIPDVLENKDYARPQAQKLMGLRAALGVPLIREGRVFGVVNLFRTTPRPFTDRQIELAETFTAQAVIAIENARLLNELRQRTDDLSEALEQQTATSKVLEVISSSPGELEPVFNAMLENAVRICEAKLGTLFLFEGHKFRAVAMRGDSYYTELTPTRRAARPCDAIKIGRAHSRPYDRQGLRERQRARQSAGRISGRAYPSRRAHAQGKRLGRRDRHLPPGCASLQRQTDRANPEFRRAGGDCHRERAAPQRAAPAHR